MFYTPDALQIPENLALFHLCEPGGSYGSTTFSSITSCFKPQCCSRARRSASARSIQPFISPSCLSECQIHQIVSWQWCRWLRAEAGTPRQKTALPLSACRSPGWRTSCSQCCEPLLSSRKTWAVLRVVGNVSVPLASVGEASGNCGDL